MKEFIEALRAISVGDFMGILVLIASAIGAIWAVFHWAYGERLKTLDTNLTETRKDFERKLERELSRELSKVMEQHKSEMSERSSRLMTVETNLSKEFAKNKSLLADLRALHQAACTLSGETPSEFIKLLEEIDNKYYFRKKRKIFTGE